MGYLILFLIAAFVAFRVGGWVLVVITLVAAALYWIAKFGGGSSGSSSGNTRRDAGSQPSSGAQRTAEAQRTGKIYKPGESAGSSGIRFGTAPSAQGAGSPSEPVMDFLTGASIAAGQDLFRCRSCSAYYARASHDLLRSDNGGRCASCGSTDLRELAGRVAGAPGRQGAQHPNQAGVATLQNFRSFEGRVATFTGTVVRVQESKRGGDFALMFENRSWKRSSFKVVVFSRAVEGLGGPHAVKAFEGATIMVRGLVVNHPTFGFEIILNDSRMVLSATR